MLRDVFYYGSKPNAHPRERYAENLLHARELATTEHFWIINEHCDYVNFDWDFDFDFLPDEDVWIKDFINVWPSEYDKDSGTWLCPKLNEDTCLYRIEQQPLKLKNYRWKILERIDMKSFDFTWLPDPYDPPYIYVWGSKYDTVETKPVLEYHADNATDRKYMADIVELIPEFDRWVEYVKVDKTLFDISWRPSIIEPPYIYVWGNKYDKAEDKPTIEYHVPGATEKKYMGIVDLEPEWDRWTEHILVDRTKFDFSWRPDPNLHEPPYIYVWGNKYDPAEVKPTLEYVVPGATEKKYMGIVDLEPEWDRWKEHIKVDKLQFDFSWRPDPNLHEPPYIYVWGNKYTPAEREATLTYTVPGATEFKYMSIATLAPEWDRWYIPKSFVGNFDFSWRPDPNLHEPPFIYQWELNGPRYTVPGATEIVYMEYDEAFIPGVVNKYTITTTIEDLINEHPDEVFWALNPDLNYDKFDFDWKPDSLNFRHINVFGNEFSKNTQTYFINGPMYTTGHREFNYVEGTKIEIESNLSMFYVDRGLGKDRFDELKLRYPQLQRTRYLNSWVETIQRCCNKSETKLLWVLNSELDYRQFNFDFYPAPWQMDMIHVFGTQWSHWGNTYIVNKETFEEHTKYVKVIEHLNVLNFVKTKRAKAVEKLYEIALIDFGNTHNIIADYEVKFKGSYLETFKELLEILPVQREHYVWVCSSICNYDRFDFTYICDPYAKQQLHVFPSGLQKFGDTFLMDVNKLRVNSIGITKLEEFDKVNYNQHQRVTRLPCPIYRVEDSQVELTDEDYNFPYAVFISGDNNDIIDDEPLNVWDDKSTNILITSTGAGRVIVPKTAHSYLKSELYDYPYIKKSSKLANSNLLDIVFLSNGEDKADMHYERLTSIASKFSNRVVRVDGVNGRANAYHAAANASNTPWFFTVFAKLEMNNKFDFTWQPDRLQARKHYIFTATNPVNNLEYGHQALIVYNKKLTLANPGIGLDFTLDDLHEVVNINSGIARYNTDPYSTWRTAFREVIKLCCNTDQESIDRKLAWLNVGNNDFGEYSKLGAKDAVNYYESVNGDIEKLRLSYEWEWLNKYYNEIYS